MADVYCIVDRSAKVSTPTRKISLPEPLAYTNTAAHAIRFHALKDDGTPEDLTGIAVVGNFLRADGNTVTPINGTVSENVAEIILPGSCYIQPGRFKCTMDLFKPTPTTGIDAFSTSTSYEKGDLVVYSGTVFRFTADHAAGAWTGTDAVADGAERTVMWVEGTVEKNVTGTIIDPGTPEGNIQQAIGQATAAAQSANEAAALASGLYEQLKDFEISTVAETKTYLGIA